MKFHGHYTGGIDNYLGLQGLGDIFEGRGGEIEFLSRISELFKGFVNFIHGSGEDFVLPLLYQGREWSGSNHVNAHR